MELTTQELEQLRTQWKICGEKCRSLRQQERSEDLLQLKQIFLSVMVILFTIFSLSGWIVSYLLP